MSYNEITGRSQTAHLGKSDELSVVDDFLWESNAIESEYSKEALEDAKKAWEYIKDVDELKISDILEVHHLLAHRIDPRIAGKIRTCSVSIGGEVKKFRGVPVIWSQLEELCEKINEDFILLPVNLKTKEGRDTEEELCKQGHVIFEEIHPFEDFNGRVGRILMNWHRVQKGLPILNIHSDWPKEGGETAKYYKWFKNN